MEKTIINTTEAPQAIGPYSQAVQAGNLLFISGQIPLDPKTGEIVGEGDVEKQTRRVMDNLVAILTAAKADLTNVVKASIFIKDMNDFATINKVYGEYFTEHYPARACVEVARLPKDVLVEIEAIATL